MKTTYGITGALMASALSLAMAQAPPAVSNAPAEFDTSAEPKVVQPAQINLSPALDEVVRLAQSGAEESVVVAYVQKAPAYSVSADEIIYLQDLGISDAVIKAVVQHGQAGGAVATPSPAAASNVPPAPASVPATTAAPPPVVTAPLTPPAEVSEFYQPLAPYGSWVIVEPYGWCWQPSVVTINAGWSPYCDNGYWLWSDSGWYWHSYYSWGWAPFHYGRWFYDPHRRWIWAPDRVWGPSWVCWRETPGYYGWAPLPPGAHFSVGIGWTFGGRHVGPDFAFGLSSAHFTFVAGQHFGDHHLSAHRLPSREVNVVYNKTTVVNNYTVGSGNRIINRGVERSRVEATTGRQFREVAVREMPRQSARTTASGVVPDRVAKVGSSDVVYRPDSRIQVPRKPAPVVTGQREALTRAEAPVHGRNSVPPNNGSRQVPRQPGQPDPARPQPPVTTPPQRAVTPSQPTPATPPPPSRTVPVRPEPESPRQVTPTPAQPAPARPPATRPAPANPNPRQGDKSDRALVPERSRATPALSSASSVPRREVPRQEVSQREVPPGRSFTPPALSSGSSIPRELPRREIPRREAQPAPAPGSAHSAYGLRAPSQRGPSLPSSDQSNRTIPERRGTARDRD
jgi:hypothetical protein